MSATVLQPVKPTRKGTRPRPRARARRKEERSLADLVRQAIDDGADSVEKIHKAIAALPLEVLDRIDGFESLPKVRQIQEESIGAVYDVIRRANREIAKLAKELLAGARQARARATSTARRRSR
jgi:hypothetical protein